MEVWTFIHKLNKNLIRFNKLDIDDDLGIIYYFSDDPYLPIWVTDNYENVEYLLNSISVSPIKSTQYHTPSNEYVNLKDYEILSLRK